MTCQYKDKLQAYLDEQLPAAEIKELEAHLSDCSQCQAELDRLLSQLPVMPAQPTGEVEDEVLLARIKARRQGQRRIFLYGFLGFLLGLFSRYYTSDPFIVTKAIMALPYKLAEFSLGIFFADNVLPFAAQIELGSINSMGFFPYHPLLDFVVTHITPALVACFLAITLGYLLSDSRVFQRTKIIRLLAGSLAVLVVWMGVLAGIYANTLTTIAEMKKLSRVTIHEVQPDGDTRWVLRLDQDAFAQENYRALKDGLTAAVPAEKRIYPQDKAGFKLGLDFAGGGKMLAYVDPGSGAMVMFSGDSYQLAPETVRLLEAVAQGVKDNV